MLDNQYIELMEKLDRISRCEGRQIFPALAVLDKKASQSAADYVQDMSLFQPIVSTEGEEALWYILRYIGKHIDQLCADSTKEKLRNAIAHFGKSYIKEKNKEERKNIFSQLIELLSQLATGIQKYKSDEKQQIKSIRNTINQILDKVLQQGIPSILKHKKSEEANIGQSGGTILQAITSPHKKQDDMQSARKPRPTEATNKKIEAVNATIQQLVKKQTTSGITDNAVADNAVSTKEGEQQLSSGEMETVQDGDEALMTAYQQLDQSTDDAAAFLNTDTPAPAAGDDEAAYINAQGQAAGGDEAAHITAQRPAAGGDEAAHITVQGPVAGGDEAAHIIAQGSVAGGDEAAYINAQEQAEDDEAAYINAQQQTADGDEAAHITAQKPNLSSGWNLEYIGNALLDLREDIDDEQDFSGELACLDQTLLSVKSEDAATVSFLNDMVMVAQYLAATSLAKEVAIGFTDCLSQLIDLYQE